MNLDQLRTELEKKSKDQLIEDYIKLYKSKERLKEELIKYKNPNTPPSAHKHLKPNTKGKKSKKDAKRGAPKGHKGTTRIQVPDRTEVIDGDKCPECGSTNLEDDKILERTTEEIQESPKPETVKSYIHKKKCLDCDHVFIPPHNTVPLKGKFGINLMVMIVFLRFCLRGVLRKVGLFLDSQFSFKITPSSINTIIKRVAKAVEKDYGTLKTRIRNSDKVYVDETSFSVLGKNWWVWVFRTSTDILLLIRPSRGSNVLKEILGKDYNGVVVCDCWSAYNRLKNAIFQRCWAHLLRKLEVFKIPIGKNFYWELRSLFGEIKRFNKENPTHKEREQKYDEMTSRLKKTIDFYSYYPELSEAIKYINNKIDQWFTCVKFPGIEPTNNFAEQAIRETVVIRKIIGAFRSIKGTQYYGILASLLATWQLQRLDLKDQLRESLIRNLCF